MSKAKQFLFLWFPPVLWCGLLFYFSSVQNLKAVQDPAQDEIIRTMVHFIFYGVLALLFFRALNYGKKTIDYLTPVILAALYGLFDEFHQIFVPTRTFQLIDLVVDFSGAVTAIIMAWKLLPRVPKKLKSWAKQSGLI